MLGETSWEAWFYLYMAYVHFRSESLDDALEACENSMNIAMDSGDASLLRRALHMKGLIQLERGEKELAQKTAEELRSLIESGMAIKAIRYSHNLFGMIKLKEGNLSESLEDLQEAQSLLPAEFNVDHSQALFLYPLAMAYSNSGDIDTARQEYKRILSLTTGRFYYGDLYADSEEHLAIIEKN
jgi:tetratricopeptide (TPR) repeat protein